MKWITREQIRVNRTETCWLIRRFLDEEGEFIFVPADQVVPGAGGHRRPVGQRLPAERAVAVPADQVESMQAQTGATGFDAPGATYPHKDAHGLCSFASLVRERLAHDSGLLEMARIVQAADIQGELDSHSAARGLQLISRGFPLVTKDDHETAERAAFVYDALYASIKEDLAPK